MPLAHDGGRALPAGAPLVLAPLGRRLLSLIYEILLVAALLWVASLLFAVVEGQIAASHARTVFQLYLAFVVGAYFVWQWTHGGQTLPMKTWRLRLVDADGAPIGAARASARYILAAAGALAVGLGFIWAVADRDRQFLHDRVAGTRIVGA